MPEGSEGEDPLSEERRYFDDTKEDLLKQHKSKFALIKGKELLGTFDTPQGAYQAGLERLGNVPMLIVRIQKQETTDWVPALQLGLVRASLQS